eukprot:scaffold17918_cov39-Phaeocystis_antarctica.AAC.2
MVGGLGVNAPVAAPPAARSAALTMARRARNSDAAWHPDAKECSRDEHRPAARAHVGAPGSEGGQSSGRDCGKLFRKFTPPCCRLEAHRDPGHHLCRHLRAQLSRRRRRRLVDGVQRNRPDGLVSRLLLRPLARPRCKLFYRRLPLWCSRDAQRRLLGGGEVAQVHCLATAPHTRLIRLGLVGLVVHAEVTPPAPAHAQRQPLRLSLLPRLLARQRRRRRRRRRCSPPRRRLPLRRPRDAQRRLLGGGEAA